MLAILVVGIAGLLYWLLRDDPVGTAEGILDLRRLPASTRNVACLDLSFTDLQIACYFELDPRDFDSLLAGRSFVKRPGSGTTRDHGEWAGLGREFQISTYYHHRLPGTRHGGSVKIATDAARERVIVDIYVE